MHIAAIIARMDLGGSVGAKLTLESPDLRDYDCRFERIGAG